MRPGCGDDCPCRAAGYSDADRSWPVFSTGERYTIDEIEPGLFAYRRVGEIEGSPMHYQKVHA